MLVQDPKEAKTSELPLFEKRTAEKNTYLGFTAEQWRAAGLVFGGTSILALAKTTGLFSALSGSLMKLWGSEEATSALVNHVGTTRKLSAYESSSVVANKALPINVGSGSISSTMAVLTSLASPDLALQTLPRVTPMLTTALPVKNGNNSVAKRRNELVKRTSGEFRVNTETAENQMLPSVAALSNGGFVIVWGSWEQDGSSWGVYGQRYDAAGSTVGSEFRINTTTANSQIGGQVSALGDGGFIVAWSSDSDGDLEGIYAQRYDAAGATVGGEFLVNTNTIGKQTDPHVSSLNDGGFVIVWRGFGDAASTFGTYGQRYDAAGATVGNEFLINTTTDDYQGSPVVTTLNNGDFVVTWNSDNQDGDERGVFGQRYSATGATLGSEFQVNTYINGTQEGPAISALQEGGYVVTWKSDGQIPTGLSDVYGQRYDANGNQVGIEFQVNTHTADSQFGPSVAGLEDGGFIIVWNSNNQDAASTNGVYGQRFDANGVNLGSEFLINTVVADNQQNPRVAALNDGGFAVTWESNNQDGDKLGIYGRRYTIPSLVNNNLNVVQSGSVDVTKAMLNATIIDNDDAFLNYQVGNMTAGQFELKNTPEGAITSFLQQQIDNNEIVFVHDGSANAPSYTISVSSGNPNMVSLPSAAVVTFNPTPVLENNTLTIQQSETKTLTLSMLSATDLDSDDNLLAFTASNVTAGQFELKTAAGVPITNFTQQQINNGDVVFVHDGGIAAPTYAVSVSDGQSATTPTLGTVLFNIAPTLVNNTLIIQRGETKTITSATLSASDVDSYQEDLSYTMGGVTAGKFALASAPSVAVTTVTEQQISNGEVVFIHDGTDIAPAYNVQVSDGVFSTTPSSATIIFDPPILVNNTLTIARGETVTLTPSMLSANDTDSDNALLTFIVSNVTVGQFELKSAPGMAISQFTQQQISDAQVQFVHNGNDAVPSYFVSVSDGNFATPASPTTMLFNSPVLANNTLTIQQGERKTLTTNDLSAIDNNTAPSALVYNIANVTAGQFELNNATTVAITSFTQQQINAGEVSFVHDDSTNLPAYTVSVSDGATNTDPHAATVTFNRRPILGSNTLQIEQGETKTIDTSILSATDFETDDVLLTFTVSNITAGQFEFSNATTVAITSFTQQQISNGDVVFVHDGSANTPSYNVSVGDGSVNTTAMPATVFFTPLPASTTAITTTGANVTTGAGTTTTAILPEEKSSKDNGGGNSDNNTAAIVAGSVVGGTVLLAGAGAAAFFAIKKYKQNKSEGSQNKQLTNRRSNSSADDYKKT